MEKEKWYFVRAKNPLTSVTEPFQNYIATNEDFKKFSQGSIDLENEKNSFSPLFARYVEVLAEVELCDSEELKEDGDLLVGIQRLVSTYKGQLKIGYTKAHFYLIYVQMNNRFYRGYKVELINLCLVGAMDFTPLNPKSDKGNIVIVKHNKRKSIKNIKYIHNELHSIIYVVDVQFESEVAMREDIEKPREVNLTSIIESLI